MFEILIVDDTKSVHAFVNVLLGKSSGIKVTSVFNGAEAIDILRSEKKFDLILLDWEMPVLNGPDTLRKIKSMSVQSPVIMMTTKNSPEDIQKMLDQGVAEYLMKPFTIDILFEKIAFASGKEFKYAA